MDAIGRSMVEKSVLSSTSKTSGPGHKVDDPWTMVKKRSVRPHLNYNLGPASDSVHEVDGRVKSPEAVHHYKSVHSSTSKWRSRSSVRIHPWDEWTGGESADGRLRQWRPIYPLWRYYWGSESRIRTLHANRIQNQYLIKTVCLRSLRLSGCYRIFFILLIILRLNLFNRYSDCQIVQNPSEEIKSSRIW